MLMLMMISHWGLESWMAAAAVLVDVGMLVLNDRWQLLVGAAAGSGACCFHCRMVLVLPVAVVVGADREQYGVLTWSTPSTYTHAYDRRVDPHTRTPVPRTYPSSYAALGRGSIRDARAGTTKIDRSSAQIQR